MALRLVYIGNFGPEFSTENDLLDTMRRMGVLVTPIQEDNLIGWEALVTHIKRGDGPDVVMWTRTRDLSERIPANTRREMQIVARSVGIPTVGVHLDRWWGLKREPDLYNDPFFRCEFVFTADGHDPDRWEAAGINHLWSPPAIAPRNVGLGTFRHELASQIAFVGSWQSYGHTEWGHRTQLVNFLRRHYGKRVRFWPAPGKPAIRGSDLADLYASTRILIGDSCLVPDNGSPWTRYCSDRVFETLGRGGFLLHPYVKGVTDGMLQGGTHLQCWNLHDWGALQNTIDFCLDQEDACDAVAMQGYDHVKKYHTYLNRLDNIFRVIGVPRSGYHAIEVVPHGETKPEDDSEAAQEPAEALIRPSGEAEVPAGHPRASGERQGASDPAVQARSDLQIDARPDPCSSEQAAEAEVAIWEGVPGA